MQKRILIPALTLLIMASASAQGQTEHQSYTPVKQFPGFEVRWYPAAVLATMQSRATSYGELSSPGFRTLADYIFGNNDSNSKIAMTAPVHMEFGQQGSSMSFVMPAEYTINQLPNPVNPAISIHESPPEYVAALSFGGYATDERIREESRKLLQYLHDNNIQPVGNIRFYGYNSPYRFWNRRNEIIVKINWE